MTLKYEIFYKNLHLSSKSLLNHDCVFGFCSKEALRANLSISYY